MNRPELQTALIDRIIEGMDIDALEICVAEYLDMNFNTYTDEQLKAEAAEFYPDLLEAQQ